MSTSLRHEVGRLFIVGLEGPELTATERAWLKLIRPSGVILFRRNIDEATQTTKLLRDATSAAGHELFRCVDLEGGLVDRLRDLVAPMPSAAAVFATHNPALYKKHGQLIAQEAKLLGFNTVFAPVLDLALPISSDVMRTRVTSPNPSDVTTYAAAFLSGLQSEGVIGCGKHFPGLGGGTLDSHHATPQILRTWDQLWKEDLAPYRALSAILPMVMISHASYPKAAKDRRPASISPFWITTVLRKKIGYRGLIISDDMEMGGILSHASIEEAAVEAVTAGTNLIEICKDPALILRAYEALLSEAERSPALRKQIRNSDMRIGQNSNEFPLRPISRTPSKISLKAIQSRIERFSRGCATLEN